MDKNGYIDKNLQFILFNAYFNQGFSASAIQNELDLNFEKIIETRKKAVQKVEKTKSQTKVYKNFILIY